MTLPVTRAMLRDAAGATLVLVFVLQTVGDGLEKTGRAGSEPGPVRSPILVVTKPSIKVDIWFKQV